MNLYKVIIAIALLLKTVAALENGTLTSTPTHIDGVLTTCAGSQISITCNHSNHTFGVTSWRFGPPINCTTSARHINPIPYDKLCPPFSFHNITSIQQEVLSSTVVAIANTSMTGTYVECRDSSGLAFNIIGKIELCITGIELILSVTDTIDMVLIEWYLTTTSEYCQRNINYTVNIDTIDKLSNNSMVIKSIIGETSTAVAGLIPNQKYTVEVSALVSSCESLTAEKNFTKSGDLTINPNEGNGRGQIQQAWIVSVAVCLTVIIVIAVIVTVVVVTLVAIRKSHNRENDSTVKVEFQKKSETSELIYAKVNRNTKRQAQTCDRPKISEDEHRVQYSEIQQQAKGLSYASVVFSTPKEEQHTTRNLSPKKPVQTTFKIQSKGKQNIVYSQVNIQRQTSTGEANEVHQNQDTPIVPDQEGTTYQRDTTAGTFSNARPSTFSSTNVI